jgi:hypothetical protein
MQVRFNLITADPVRLGDSLKFTEAEVRPVVESLFEREAPLNPGARCG